MDIQSILIAATEAVQNAAPAVHDAVQAAAETGAAETAAEAAHADPGLLGTLGIDIKLFIAQLVNFGIVLFVFWKYIAGPLGKAMVERQAKIESGLKNADYMEEEKRKFEAWKADEMKSARTEAEKILKTATETSEKISQETAASTQDQASRMIEQAKAAIAQEKDLAMKEARQDIANLVVLASEKVIKAKLDAPKDRELVADAVKGLK